MAIGTIRITPEQIRDEATKLKGLSDQHDGVFKQMTNLINALSSQWEGAAIEAFLQSFTNAKTELEKFRKSIDVFEKDMRESARILEETDKALGTQLKR